MEQHGRVREQRRFNEAAGKLQRKLFMEAGNVATVQASMRPPENSSGNIRFPVKAPPGKAALQ